MAVTAIPYSSGDPLPGGVEAKSGFWPNEATLWIPAHRGLVTGDVFLGIDGGLRTLPDSCLPGEITSADVRAGLQPLLDLPVELVLPTHGKPVVERARESLRAALT
jgi:hypothetical protein